MINKNKPKQNQLNSKDYKENLNIVLFEYLGVIALWLLIFGKNAFSNLLFVDYTYSTFFDFFKVLIESDFSFSNYLFHIFNSILSIFSLQFIAFQLSILISMLISFYYIKKIVNEKRLYYLLFSFIFFFNPFVYSRIMIGQLGVLLAYLLLPVYLYYLFNLFESNFDTKSLVKVTIAYTIVALFSIHFFLLNFFIFIIASFWYRDKIKDKIKLRNYTKVLGIFVLFLILLNSFWLQSLFSNQIFSVINSEHESFFAPKMSEGISAIAKIMGMWGFWREVGYVTTYRSVSIRVWYPLLIILVLLLIAGYYLSNHDRKSKIFYSLFWIGLILGVGISHPYTKFIFDWFFNYLPFFNGFRDSHKFVSLIALAYAYFIPISIIKLKEKLRGKKLINILVMTLFVLFIIFYTFPLINLRNQVKSVECPKEYYDVNDFLENQEIKGHIIYLPWQNYLTYKWTIGSSSDGRIAVPINKIVKNQVLIGSDQWGAGNQLNTEISSCINNKDISCLEDAGIEYILKDKCAYFPDNYGFISSERVLENNCFEIYKLDNKMNKNPTKVPLRFILGTLTSLITLLFFIILLKKK